MRQSAPGTLCLMGHFSVGLSIVLEVPSSECSRSFEKYQDKDRPLDTADFEVRVDEENKVSIIGVFQQCHMQPAEGSRAMPL